MGLSEAKSLAPSAAVSIESRDPIPNLVHSVQPKPGLPPIHEIV